MSDEEKKDPSIQDVATAVIIAGGVAASIPKVGEPKQEKKEVGAAEWIGGAAGIGTTVGIATGVQGSNLDAQAIVKQQESIAEQVGKLSSGAPELEKLTAQGKRLEQLAESAKLYENASLFKKPMVAFSSLTTGGKIGVGAITAAAGLGTGWLINKWRNSGQPSHVEQLSADAGAKPENPAR